MPQQDTTPNMAHTASPSQTPTALEPPSADRINPPQSSQKTGQQDMDHQNTNDREPQKTPYLATIVTLFPDMFPGMLAHSLNGKAHDKGLWDLNTINIRDFSPYTNKSVDDYPYGGGNGMIIRPNVVDGALQHALQSPGRLVHMTPRGTPLKQHICRDLSKEEGIIILCGHYEAIDERVLEKYREEHNMLEISIGDFILSGGETAAFILLDSIFRLLPGTLANTETVHTESFEDSMQGLLEYPQYTKPALWQNRAVPDILRSGHHENIKKWRHDQSIKITQDKRPDLLPPSQT